jgi:hypothetical protein
MLIDKTEHKTKFQIACTIPLLHTVPASIVINENAIPIVATDKTVIKQLIGESPPPKICTIPNRIDETIFTKKE